MFGYVAPTDKGWFDYLASTGPHSEVNFWTPSGRGFSALAVGEPFFFKLKGTDNSIGGFGIFVRSEQLPLWLAWDSFGEGNGARDEDSLIRRVSANRSATNPASSASPLGCRLIGDPIFFPPSMRVTTPADWQRSIVAGKRYDLSAGEGARIWQECLERAAELRSGLDWTVEALAAARFGKPLVIRPRLGQGGFRLAVYDAYGRACCITGEHSLPVLEAAHIKPYSKGGEHLVSNGLPLRRDLHRLFDLGYVTVKTDLTFLVGDRLRVEYHNGHSYYQLQGQPVHVPERLEQQPDVEYLEWHNDVVYHG